MTSEARFIRADRLQTRWDFIDLEALLPSDHRARIVLRWVGSNPSPPLASARGGRGTERPSIWQQD